MKYIFLFLLIGCSERSKICKNGRIYFCKDGICHIKLPRPPLSSCFNKSELKPPSTKERGE